MTNILSIDKAGRIVIPQVIRKMLGLNAGAFLKMDVTERAVVLTPVEQPSAMVRENGVLVYGGDAPREALLEIISAERDARASTVWGHSV